RSTSPSPVSVREESGERPGESCRFGGARPQGQAAPAQSVGGGRQDGDMTSTPEFLRTTLAAAVGPEAKAREDQERAVVELVDHRRRVLVVQATGWASRRCTGRRRR